MANYFVLLKKNELEKKQEKKRNIYIGTIAVSALVISSLIITL